MTLWLRDLATSRDKLKPSISTTTMPMATKLGRMLTYLKGLLTIKSTTPWSRGLAKSHNKRNRYTSTNRAPMATRLGRMVASLDGLLPIKSHDPLITWSCEITRQAKTVISLLQECLWKPNLAEWWLPLMGSYL